MLLKSKAAMALRGNQEFLVISRDQLYSWAQTQGLSRHRALELALEEGIFPEDLERNFPSFSATDQLALWRSRVLVAGLGGLGGCQAQLLARAGVGRLYLADGDSFMPSNLNRQLLATTETLGQNKALVTAEFLRQINEALEVEAIPEFLGQGNLQNFLPEVQVVLDALDTLETRREIVAAASMAGVPIVHGAVSGTFGQVTTILPQDSGKSSWFFQMAAAPEPELAPGVLAPVVTLTASLQAMEALRLLLKQEPVYHGVLAHFDGDTGRMEILPLE
jgi:molybdopterin/thiamine biosynthesis adenylyltransferase